MGLDYRVRCCPDGLMTDRRRRVQVLDVTLRDGGLCNAWRFDEALVRDTWRALRDAGVDVMEVGYQANESLVADRGAGPLRWSREADLRRFFEPSGMRLSCMVDVGRVRVADLRPAAESLVDVLRIACYAHQIEEAIELCHGALDLGYDVFCNVMAVTTCSPQQVDAFLDRLRASRVRAVAVVDSYGAMYPHHLRYLIRKYKNWLRPDQQVAVHLHNNQQTAFANAIAAVEEGADWIDASVFGMGRGAGNVPLELLLMHLDDPRHDVRPVLGLLDRYVALRDELRWGYEVPYGVTGWLNQHPRAAIDRMRHSPVDPLGFYDELVADRPRASHHRPQREQLPVDPQTTS